MPEPNKYTRLLAQQAVDRLDAVIEKWIHLMREANKRWEEEHRA